MNYGEYQINIIIQIKLNTYINNYETYIYINNMNDNDKTNNSNHHHHHHHHHHHITSTAKFSAN